MVSEALDAKHQKILARTMEIEDKVLACVESSRECDRLQLSGRLHQCPTDSSILLVGNKHYLSNLVCEIIFHKKKAGKPGDVQIMTKRRQARTLGGVTLKRVAKIRNISLIPKMNEELAQLLTSRILKLLHYTVVKTTK